MFWLSETSTLCVGGGGGYVKGAVYNPTKYYRGATLNNLWVSTFTGRSPPPFGDAGYVILLCPNEYHT